MVVEKGEVQEVVVEVMEVVMEVAEVVYRRSLRRCWGCGQDDGGEGGGDGGHLGRLRR